MNKPRLEPCPFCGGKAQVMDMGYPHWVYCIQCGAQIHGRTHNKKDSITAWNMRIVSSPYGEWIPGREISRDYIGDTLLGIQYENWRCSNCDYITEDYRKPTWKYCPNCGERMKGGDK